MLENGLVKDLERLGHVISKTTLKGTGESETIGKMKNAKAVSEMTENVSKVVKSALGQQEFALTLGGDHSLAIGTISGSLAVYSNLGVIWVDAHAGRN